ncbi:MAG: ABATE domain-containing protein [Acidobacteriota bacterium]
MDDEPDFHFLGNHLAVDFLNTVARGPDGPVDRIPDADAWRRWVVAVGLPSLDFGAPDVASAFQSVPALRSAIRSCLDAWKSGDPPPPRDLAQVNAVLESPPPSPPLVVTDGAWRRQAPTVASSPTEPLWHIADAAATLLATGDRRRFKACSGHD